MRTFCDIFDTLNIAALFEINYRTGVKRLESFRICGSCLKISLENIVPLCEEHQVSLFCLSPSSLYQRQVELLVIGVVTCYHA